MPSHCRETDFQPVMFKKHSEVEIVIEHRPLVLFFIMFLFYEELQNYKCTNGVIQNSDSDFNQSKR